MQKSFILLTKSRKFKNYCIAGIGQGNGNWIRLVSDSTEIHCAVPKVDFTYEDGTEAQIFDIISVSVKEQVPLYYQPENIQYDSHYYWEKIGTSSLMEVLDLIQQNPDPYIFFSTDKRISRGFFDNPPIGGCYSLKIINIDSATLQAKRWSANERIKYDVLFRYNGNFYCLRVTDDDFVQHYTAEGNYTLNNVTLVLSLADLYDVDQCHHKLVAAIII